VIAPIVSLLACPDCLAPLRRANGALRCASGHSFDIARQGYASLVGGRPPAVPGDTAAMVEARERILGAGHLAPLTEAIAAWAAELAEAVPRGPCVLELGAGSGRQLAAALERMPDRLGVALDLSKPALRRAAKAHRRAGAVAADAWGRLPLADAAAAVALSVFAPRNGGELRRVLHPRGALLVVTPTPAHLGELVEPLGLLAVDPRKEERLAQTLAPHFLPGERRAHEHRLSLDRSDLEAIALMGPSAWHLDRERLRQRVAELPEPTAATCSAVLSVHLPRPSE
jgi:23S rRNA (guanine745-N1)-methyltransferase